MVFKDNADGNTVIINDAELIENTGYIGGGVYIASDSGSYDYWPSVNTVIINSSRFISNVANTGGGIAVEANRDDNNKLQIENCVFDNNYAIHRSLLYKSSTIDHSLTIHNSTIVPWHSIAVNYPSFIPAECTWQGWVVFIMGSR